MNAGGKFCREVFGEIVPLVAWSLDICEVRRESLVSDGGGIEKLFGRLVICPRKEAIDHSGRVLSRNGAKVNFLVIIGRDFWRYGLKVGRGRVRKFAGWR